MQVLSYFPRKKLGQLNMKIETNIDFLATTKDALISKLFWGLNMTTIFSIKRALSAWKETSFVPCCDCEFSHFRIPSFCIILK